MSPPRRKLLERRSADDAAEYQLVPTTESRPVPQSNARSLIKTAVHPRSNSYDRSPSPRRPNKREALLENLLHFSDEDICWVLDCAMRTRPSLESYYEDHKHQLKFAAYAHNSTQTRSLDDNKRELQNARAENFSDSSPSAAKYNESEFDLPVLQFLAPMFFASEGQSYVQASVLRTGKTNCRSQVSYRTHDDSALAGKVYKASTGVLVFEPGEVEKDVFVEMIDDSNWNPSREFQIQLLREGLVNGIVEKYLWHTRVLVVDDDPFPTGKFKQLIKDDKLEEVPTLRLTVEYFKMQWSNDKIRRASKKIIAADMVGHVNFMLKALLQMYLVDSVLNARSPEDHLFLVHNRYYTLTCAAIALLAPQFLLHHIALQQPYGVGTESRKLLMKSLFGRFLNYSPAVDIPEGDILMGISRDSLDVVKNMYRGVFDVMKLCGKVIFIVATQFVAPILFHQPIRWITIIPLCLFPIAMFGFVAIRDRQTTAVLFERLKQHDALVEFVAEAVQNQSFINECNARVMFLDHCEAKINSYHAARKVAKHVVVNNRQFAKWLSTLMLAFYTLTGGLAVIHGQLRLGLYVTNLKMFENMGKIYSDIYLKLLSIQQVTPGLKRLVRLLNVTTDLNLRAEMSQHSHAQADQLFATLSAQARSDAPLIDQLPICIRSVTFRYEVTADTETKHTHSILSKIDGSQGGVNFQGDMRLSQGQFVEFIGPHGEGKTTLLKLLGGVLLPKLSEDLLDATSPYFFVPPHLNTIYVPSEPIFFRSTLRDNLSLCVWQGSSDDSLERIFKVCERIGLVDGIARHLEDDSGHSWLHHVSHLQKSLLCLARALIANPQLLCIERHWMGFDESASTRILQMLREHVDCRGLEQHGERGHKRRPRTCVMTGSEKSSLELLDCIFCVSQAKGIEEVHRRAGL